MSLQHSCDYRENVMRLAEKHVPCTLKKDGDAEGGFAKQSAEQCISGGKDSMAAQMRLEDLEG